MKLQSINAKREVIVISALLCINFVLWFINQELSSNLYIPTPQYQKNLNQIAKFIQSNNILNLELLHLESYSYIEQVATKEGFVPASFMDLR